MTRYELLDRIGVGGMAEIFRGRALAAGGFEKPVAIKRILPHLCQDQRFVELLIAEAKVLSMLRHRNIVQIFDVGLGDDGQYFLVMEFVNGLDLGRVQAALEDQRRLLPVDLALHIGAEVCEALEHAHIANDPEGKPMRLVHRDISPSNVLLSRAGEVKLTDFGIAKRAEEVTGHGTVRGKFAYISPEQARNEHVDPRSDVFSLGIVLFELLTGTRLFSGLSDLEALLAARSSAIPRPRELDGNLPVAIDELIGKALARDPEQRFASAGAFGAALRSLRYSLEVSSGDPSLELARVVDNAEHPTAQPVPANDFEPSESTVIRIRTADAFSMDDARTAFSKARKVIDRFAEEETRLSKLSPEMLRNLQNIRDEPSGEHVAPPPARARAPRPAGRRPTSGDEPTALADPLERDRLLELERDRQLELARDQAFELEEETIARPSPLRVAPTTLKRVPPPPVLPARAASRGDVGERPSTVAGRGRGGSPAPSMMPDASGWEPPSYSPPPSSSSARAGGHRPAPHAVPNPASMGTAAVAAGPAPPSYPAAASYVDVEPATSGRPPGYGPQPHLQPPPPARAAAAGRPSRAAAVAAERWRTAALVLGAIAMAVLAFAVTRSCMHQDAKRPAAGAPPPTGSPSKAAPGPAGPAGSAPSATPAPGATSAPAPGKGATRRSP